MMQELLDGKTYKYRGVAVIDCVPDLKSNNIKKTMVIKQKYNDLPKKIYYYYQPDSTSKIMIIDNPNDIVTAHVYIRQGSVYDN
jgi:hypothetical protein